MGRHYYRPLAQAAIKRAHLVADTQAVADELIEDFSVRRDDVTVVPLGVGLPEPQEGTRSRDRPYLLAVGTLEPRKNLKRLADAYSRSGVTGTHDLLVVGRQAWGEAPVGIRVLSGLDDQALAETYAGASALLLPSLYEGFGLPVIEAMQLGVPVVCSDIPVLREVSGGFAHYVDPTDTDSLIEGVRAATTMSAPAGAREWARRTWSWDRTVSDLSALYRRLDS
jgi:glycosyltransferase involved in cell wall biosynthesis